ncbi:hypothetical protein D3C80_1763840 [compost metagenome]
MAFGLKLMLAALIDLENLLGVRQKLFAFIRKMNLLAQAVEHPAIQLPLQRLNTGRYRRLRNIQHLGRFIEASIMVDVDKRLNIINIHSKPSLKSFIILTIPMN